MSGVGSGNRSPLFRLTTAYVVLVGSVWSRPAVRTDDLQFPFAEPAIRAYDDGLRKLTCQHGNPFLSSLDLDQKLAACQTEELQLHSRCRRKQALQEKPGVNAQISFP
jgi:hypothetical protein